MVDSVDPYHPHPASFQDKPNRHRSHDEHRKSGRRNCYAERAWIPDMQLSGDSNQCVSVRIWYLYNTSTSTGFSSRTLYSVGGLANRLQGRNATWSVRGLWFWTFNALKLSAVRDAKCSSGLFPPSSINSTSSLVIHPNSPHSHRTPLVLARKSPTWAPPSVLPIQTPTWMYQNPNPTPAPLHSRALRTAVPLAFWTTLWLVSIIAVSVNSLTSPK